MVKTTFLNLASCPDSGILGSLGGLESHFPKHTRNPVGSEELFQVFDALREWEDRV